MAHVVETQGEASLPTSVIRLARDYLAGWRGEDAGIEQPMAGRGHRAARNYAERAAARLVLLAALAAYRVDARIVGEFQRHFPRRSISSRPPHGEASRRRGASALSR